MFRALLPVLGFAGAALAACNGHDELCSRKYSEVTFMGAHDSAFYGVLPTDDQHLSVTDQLQMGIRFVEVQTHDDNGTVELCHTYCWELDAGPLSDYLSDVADFMKANTNEVVTMIVTNGDNISLDRFDAIFSSTGLKDLAFSPNGTISKDQWPTLQEMIDSGKRLVVLMDYNANRDTVDYILPEFDFFWETSYGVTDSSFPDCSVNRPTGGDPAKLMGIMNHMLNVEVVGITIPDQEKASDTNSQDSIQKEVDNCKSAHNNIQPNVILLDWVDQGDAIAAGNALNGLS